MTGFQRVALIQTNLKYIFSMFNMGFCSTRSRVRPVTSNKISSTNILSSQIKFYVCYFLSQFLGELFFPTEIVVRSGGHGTIPNNTCAVQYNSRIHQDTRVVPRGLQS